jgi:uncharacterized membrane protein YphA (DoxX/SURF4 family)
MASKTRRISLLSIRILLGVVFLLSGIGKLINDSDARYLVELLATKFYWMIEYTGPIVLAITIIELLLAFFLLWGKKLRWVLGGALLLIIAFSGILSYFYWQGFGIKSCGCFGALDIGGGLTFSLLKNVVLLALIIGAYCLIPSRNKPLQKSTGIPA